MLSDLTAYLAGKRLLILGFGREGRSTLAFLQRHQAAIQPLSITIADGSVVDTTDLPTGVAVVCGVDYLDAIRGADLVFKSPGISFRDLTIVRQAGRIYLEEFPGVEISGQMDLFLRFSPARVIGVSGTKGKSTTTTLCYQILRHFSPKAYMLGNIGVPVLDHFDELDSDSYCAVEMSSHQLEFVSAAPEVAVLTNFYPEHLDHYRDYDEYINAKLNLLRFQEPDGTAILNANEAELMDIALPFCQGRISLVSDRHAVRYFDESFAGRVEEHYELSDDRTFACGPEWAELPANRAMLGRHVLMDALLALAATARLGVPRATQLEAIAVFGGIAHRLEPVGEVGGVLYYNDSIATIPKATILALEALQTVAPVTVLLLGGMDRGLDYTDFVEELYRFPLRDLLCFPQTGSTITQLAARHNAEHPDDKQLYCHEVTDMEQAVALAKSLCQAGEVCLLSPAASSYNQYKNFEERGNRFREAVLGGGGAE